MKKIKFYIPALALVAGLSLTTLSCVDDTESSTVTALRGARAEQLKAEAALKNAQAEATKITSEADAALTLAEAKYKEAVAKGEEIQLAKTQAEVDLAVAQAKGDLQKLQISLQTELLALQQALDMAKNGDPVLEDAIDKYKSLIGKVNDLKINIEMAKVDIVGAKGVLAALEVKAPNALESQILFIKHNIADLEVDIAKDTKELAYWNNLVVSNDVKALKAEMTRLKTAEDKINFTELPPLEKAEDAAVTSYNNAVDLLRKFRDNGAMKYTSGWNNELDMMGAVYYSIAELDIEIRNIEVELKNAEVIKTKAEADFAAANAKIDGLHAALKAATAKTVAAQTTYNNALDAQANLPANATPAQVTAAQQAVTAAGVALAAAQTAESDADIAYGDQHTIVITNQNTITAQANIVASYNADLAAMKEVKALYKDDKTPATLEASVKTTLAAKTKAVKAADDKRTEAQVLSDSYDSLEGLTLNGAQLLSEYKPAKIKALELSIADNKDAVAGMNVYIAESKASNTNAVQNQKAIIANLEKQLAQDEADLKVQEKLLEAAKKVVDDKLK
ncbi:hypothetical protein [Dysgonomonas sp. ZJ279]|uniref:hypothetical protein n=1 Tax=Dysgonomonas sp. ZJ279 TaxID=2709796 RepID=UPI0013ECD24D|nr:hypothetical protein [Dysgonomonas sp. ZJ279]